MSTHKNFCEWMQRNRPSLSPEQWRAADILCRWLYVSENGPMTPQGKEAMAEACKNFRRLVGNGSALARLHDA